MNTAEHLKHIELDEYGILKRPELWNKEVAQMLATELDIGVLTSDHWNVIDALRKHYERFGVAPAMHNICRSSHHSGLPDPGEEAKAYLNDM